MLYTNIITFADVSVIIILSDNSPPTASARISIVVSIILIPTIIFAVLLSRYCYYLYYVGSSITMLKRQLISCTIKGSSAFDILLNHGMQLSNV